jgi:hypothetical protein
VFTSGQTSLLIGFLYRERQLLGTTSKDEPLFDIFHGEFFQTVLA